VIGRILWYSEHKSQGIILVDNGGEVGTRYFLLKSKIIKSPAVISAGMYVKFKDYLNPKRPDLLPVAVQVVVSENPFVDVSRLATMLSQGGVE
jgi:hypothetical protein